MSQVCVKSWECVTAVVITATIVDMVQRREKKSTVHTSTKIDMSLNNVSSRILTGKNARTITRIITKKKCDRRNKNTTKKEKGGRLMSLMRYSMTSYFWR